MLKGFVIGFFCFVFFLFLHIILFHNRRIKYRFATLICIFCSLLPIYVIFYLLIPAEAVIIMPADPRITPGVVIGLSKIFNFFLGILIYLLLFFGYCQFYFIVDRWSTLIKKIYADPLICPSCGGRMKIIAFIKKKSVIEHILKHLGLLDELPHAHSPPSTEPREYDITYEPLYDDLTVPEQIEHLQATR